jgi:hypothetical protein
MRMVIIVAQSQIYVLCRGRLSHKQGFSTERVSYITFNNCKGEKNRDCQD